MTPTLDQLAANGVRYTHAYTATPLCIPTRRSLMTGTTPRTHGDRVFNETFADASLTRPWHLPERLHPTVWSAYEMYREADIPPAYKGDWAEDFEALPYTLKVLRDYWPELGHHTLRHFRQAFYAQCTLINHQIRLVIGTLEGDHRKSRSADLCRVSTNSAGEGHRSFNLSPHVDSGTAAGRAQT